MKDASRSRRFRVSPERSLAKPIMEGFCEGCFFMMSRQAGRHPAGPLPRLTACLLDDRIAKDADSFDFHFDDVSVPNGPHAARCSRGDEIAGIRVKFMEMKAMISGMGKIMCTVFES